MNWLIHHKAETASTNLDARAGHHGDVFTADYQTAGRGRLDHKWLSLPKTNLMMSAVLSVEGLAPEQVATLPLVVGLSVIKAVEEMVGSDVLGRPQQLKWPNDVLIDGKKIAGILCERNGDNVIAGIGVNVGQTEFPPEIAERATSLRIVCGAPGYPPSEASSEGGAMRGGRALPSPDAVRDQILSQLDRWYGIWRVAGFAAVHSEIAAVDFLKGREIAVRQTDDDSDPIVGVSNGIMPDGSLDVGGIRVYAGEAHVEKL